MALVRAGRLEEQRRIADELTYSSLLACPCRPSAYVPSEAALLFPFVGWTVCVLRPWPFL